MIDKIPNFTIYRLYNIVTKKWYRSNNCSTFGNTSSIKNSLKYKNINMEDYLIVVIKKDEPFTLPLNKIYE